MADPSSTERLQPSLLDRLTDDAPTVLTEPREARVLTKGQLRTAVLRDLAALMNAICLGAGDDLSAYPEVERSVLNYGLPSMSGESVGRLELRSVSADIKQAILDFEPRIDPTTLEVEAQIDGSARSHHNQLKLVIRGHMWNQPVPLELLLSASLDVETGQAAVRDMRG